jgi:hypothetical protein
MIYVIGIVEMCERFAYYGTTAVCTYISCQVRDMCTDVEQSSISFSNLYRPPVLSHQLVLQVAAKPVLWVWDSRLLQVLFNSISSSAMLCPWLVSSMILYYYGQH